MISRTRGFLHHNRASLTTLVTFYYNYNTCYDKRFNILKKLILKPPNRKFYDIQFKCKYPANYSG